jgi:phage-related tail fiber protein
VDTGTQPGNVPTLDANGLLPSSVIPPSPPATLPDSGVVPGTYTKVAVNAKGQVTSGNALVASDIPSLTLAKISNAGTAAALNSGTSAGNVPTLGANGKLPSGVLPDALLGASGVTPGTYTK